MSDSLHVTTEAALGSSAPGLIFASGEQVASVVGQRIKFSRADALQDPEDTRFHQGSSPHGISLVAACPKAGCFAFVERVRSPRVAVCSFPDMLALFTLESDALEYTALAFSRSGTHFAALSGNPAPALVLWELPPRQAGGISVPVRPCATGPLTAPLDSISFNPSDHNSMCTLAGKRLMVWKHTVVYKTPFLDSTEIEAPTPEGASGAGLWTSHAWSLGDQAFASSDTGAVVSANAANPSGTAASGPAAATPAATRDPFAALDVAPTEQVVEPLDAAGDMPEGLSFDVWDRLVDARAAKVASEEELRISTARLAEMHLYLARLSSTDEELAASIEALDAKLAAKLGGEQRDNWDLELPFKLKQGQIEVEEAAVVTDFGEAQLIHRSEVSDLNTSIRTLGGEKVQILKEIRDFRKGIVQLQWENKRADMEAVDLVERTKEFQLLRVTKGLQDKIRGGSDDNQQFEVTQLEKKLEAVQRSHEDKVSDLRRQVAKIGKLVSDKRLEMQSLMGQIEQLEGSVMEREMIHEIQSKNADASGDAFKRFEQLHMKRKLQTLVGMQTQEIELLRDELDRLRRRTFPTFTQPEAHFQDAI